MHGASRLLAAPDLSNGETALCCDSMKRAFITGANRGIGLALVDALVNRDVFVFGGARKPDAARELDRLREHHPNLLQILPLDVESDDSVRRCADTVKAATVTLDILVNNAAVFLEETDTPLAALDVDGFAATVAVNVGGVARVTQAFLPALIAAENPRVINISSGAGSIGDKTDHQFYCYGASKAALNHFTVGLAHELRPRGVIVVAISPGWVRTDMGGPKAELSPEESGGAIADTILKLESGDSGCFLDRFGHKGKYVW
jgi:NAD(P)-dependent dehydrogenase (short-subunit alcohol dehydrogenase family)